MAVDQSQARKNFKSELYKRGWTAKEVAAKIELSESTLYNWMKTTDPKNLGSGSLVRLAHLFNIDPEEFLGTEGLAGLDAESVTSCAWPRRCRPSCSPAQCTKSGRFWLTSRLSRTLTRTDVRI